MTSGDPLTPGDVQALAREGRVAKAPNYHASDHNLRFDTLVMALCWCYGVRDLGEHPGSFRAQAINWGKERFEIDFVLGETVEGDVILIVTAWRKAP